MTRSFYGWHVVAAVFALTFVGFGSAYTFGSFVTPLQSAFHVSRGTVALVFGVAGFLYFALGALTGPVADRIGARPLILLGVVLMGGGMCAASVASSATGALAGYALGVGVGLGCVYVPALSVVQRWFVRHRGLASGFAVSGIGVGTLILPPMAHWLIHALGWRPTYLVLGISTLAIGVGAALMIRDDPATFGQYPDGAASPPTQMESDGLSVREAMRSKAFVQLFVGILLIGFGAFVPFVHLVPDAIERGSSSSAATWLIAIIGFGSTAGRFMLGGWADRVGRDTAFVVMCCGMAAATGLWALAPAYWGLVVFAIAFGLSYGGWVALLPALVADLFGPRHAGAIIGVLYSSVAIGTLAGPFGAGVLYDKTGNYFLAIVASALLALIGTVAVWPLARADRAS